MQPKSLLAARYMPFFIQEHDFRHHLSRDIAHAKKDVLCGVSLFGRLSVDVSSRADHAITVEPFHDTCTATKSLTNTIL